MKQWVCAVCISFRILIPFEYATGLLNYKKKITENDKKKYDVQVVNAFI